MRRNPERLAWTVLLISLFVCIALTVSVPLAVSSFINDTVETASITLEVQQGTALVYRPGLADPIGVNVKQDNLPERSIIHTDQIAQALLTIRAPRDGSTLLTVPIYGSTDLEIVQAQSPRFTQSLQPHNVQLSIEGGRVRVNVASNLTRELRAHVVTPQAAADLQDGSYSIEVSNNIMQITVRDGLATVSAQGSLLTINQPQRVTVQLGSPPVGPLSPGGNLITNGNFRLSLDTGWSVSNDLVDKNEAPGIVSIVANNGRPAARFERQGLDHAETDLRQIIIKDVRGFRSLKLSFVVQVSNQDVPVCGTVGSECPLAVKLTYKDGAGTDRDWIQGFYNLTDPNPRPNPTICVSCPPESRNDHKQVPLDFAYTYESDNLMGLLSPSQITSITFYASGHSYRAYVSEVELLGEQ